MRHPRLSALLAGAALAAAGTAPVVTGTASGGGTARTVEYSGDLFNEPWARPPAPTDSSTAS
ncbi:hypothetical protein AB0A60_16020 [Streptomyces sp. NPDC046275]|uniref:hypothetical protein n=1 Tax=Streptomyces sp. NPDC046275 TaxID=3157201 RepID=UPI0033FF7301